MQPGTCIMRLDDYGSSAAPGSGAPQIYVQFKAANGESINWYGGTKEEKSPNAKMSQWEFTLKTLQTMGYQGDTSAMGACAALYDGPLSSPGLTVQDYELVLVLDKWKDDKGEHEKVKVQYINKPGEGGGVGKKFASKEEMMAAFSKAVKSAGAGAGHIGGEPTGEEYFKKP